MRKSLKWGVSILLILTTLSVASPAQAGQKSRRKSRIEHVYKTTTVPSAARVAKFEANRGAERCHAKKVTYHAENLWHAELFTFWRSVYWCYQDNKFTKEIVNHDYTMNPSLWNAWEYSGVTGRSYERRVNAEGTRVHYAGLSARFEACILGYCYADVVVNLTQTIRANGTYEDTWGPKEGQL